MLFLYIFHHRVSVRLFGQRPAAKRFVPYPDSVKISATPHTYQHEPPPSPQWLPLPRSQSPKNGAVKIESSVSCSGPPVRFPGQLHLLLWNQPPLHRGARSRVSSGSHCRLRRWWMIFARSLLRYGCCAPPSTSCLSSCNSLTVWVRNHHTGRWSF